MRQIKFRGKRINGNEILIGDLNHINGLVYIFPRTEEAPLNSPDWFQVEPESVGQFTGLYDKNYNEIFEKDKLRWISSNPFSIGQRREVEVSYVEGHFWCRGSVGVYLGELLINEKCEIFPNQS